MNKVKKQQNKVNNIYHFIPDGEFYFEKGVEAFHKRKFDYSLKWLQKAIDAEPENPLYKCQMSIVYTETGKYYLANDLLNSALQTEDYVDCYYLLANNCAHLGLLEDAKNYAETYLEKDPDGEFYEEAHTLLDIIDFDAEDDFDEEWLLEEDDLIKYQETAFHYMENEKWEKAMPIIEEMMELYPDHAGVKHDYAQALFYTGEKEKAIELELKSAEDPNLLQSIMNLALFYHDAEKQRDYNEMLGKLVNVYPVHSDQQIRLAVILAKTGNYEESMKRFRKVERSMARGHLSYYRWYSMAAYYQGELDLAIELWKEGCLRFRALEDYSFPWMDE